jgi:RecA-family ATPase
MHGLIGGNGADFNDMANEIGVADVADLFARSLLARPPAQDGTAPTAREQQRPRMTRTPRNDDYGADAGIIAQAEIDRHGDPDAIDEAFFDPSTWDGVPVPPRQWMVEHWLPLLSTTYLTGLGATGKSLLTQQLATCVARNIKFLGIEVRHCKAAYITCEDDLDELHRRQDAINAILGVTWADLKGRLLLRSLKGEQGVEFATFDNSNVMTVTSRYRTIRNTLIQFGVEFSVFDNVAHLFAGNENIRGQVAQFCGLMDRIAMDTGGASLLLGHPNKAGAEFSGSTAWENQVRSRIYLKRPEDDGYVDPDARILSRSKPNYAQKGEEVAFIWKDWAFTRMEDLSADRGAEIAANSRANFENDVFLSCLRERARQGEGRLVGPSPGPNYAPTQFEGTAHAKGMSGLSGIPCMDGLIDHQAAMARINLSPKSTAN